MKVYQTSVFLVALILILNGCYNGTSESLKEEATQTSGAYEAMNFLADARIYPFEEYPAKAHYAAWQQVQNQAISREDTPPWESMGPINRGGRTLNIAFNPENPNTMYMGSASGGLWRTYTGGNGAAAWELVHTGFPLLGVSSIAFPPNDSTTIYIGTGEVYNFFAAGTGAAYRSTRGSYGMGILKSEDGGDTWSLSLDWTAEQTRGIWAIRVDPNNTDIVWTATTHGIYKSEDAGASWVQKLDVIMGNDLLLNPNNSNEIIAACGNLESAGYGIYKSMDGGETWAKQENGLPSQYAGKIQLALSPSQPNVVWTSIGNGFSFSDGASWLVKSTDFGSNWEIINTTDYSKWQGWFAHDVVVHPEEPDVITTIGIEIWQSTNGGTNLLQITQGGIGFPNPAPGAPDGPPDFVHSDAHDIIYHPENSNTIYVASDGGLHRSEDGGQTWRSLNGGYQTAQFYNGFSTSQNDTLFCLGGLQDNGTWVWNGDQTWQNVWGGDGAWTAINPTNDDVFYVSSQRLNVVRFSNNSVGIEGVDIPEIDPVAFIAPYVIDKSNGLTLYAGTATIAKSINGGNNWTFTNSFNFNGNPFLAMEISHQDPEVVYAASAPYNGVPGEVFVTTNGGTIWTDISNNLPDRYPMDMTVDPNDDAIAYITYSGFASGHVFKTTDYGSNWEDISSNLPDVPTNAVVVDPLTNIVYVGNDIGVFYTEDEGGSWEPFQDGVPTAIMVFDMKISNPNRKLRIVTHGNGAYQRDLIDEPITNNESIATNLSIETYPNPFEEAFLIKMVAPQQQTISLELLDSTGKRLKNITQAASIQGTAEWQVSGANLSNGIYFIRLSTDGKQWVKRLVKQ